MLILIKAKDMSFKSVEDYYNSFKDKIDELSYAISLVNEGAEKYFNWINIYEENMYYLVDDSNPNYILGYGNFENNEILDFHLDYLNDGAISYEIRPNERKKGYGNKLLELLLKECETQNMNEVCISCLEENIYSKKIILNNNGILEKRFFDDTTGKYALKFWIDLNPKTLSKIKKKS